MTNHFVRTAALAAVLFLSVTAPAADRSAPTLDWPDFFAAVKPDGATYSEKLLALDGKRVVLRGYAVLEPRVDGGIFLTRFREGKLHPDDEETLPWDAVAVLWRKGIALPPVPPRPTVEGTLRVGPRRLGTESVSITLEDAVPKRGDSRK